MAVSNISSSLIGVDSKGKNGYETLRDVIKTQKIKKITKRDALYLINKQMEGVSETNGNLFIYMFYFAGVDPSGRVNSVEWYKGIRANDIGAGGTETTESTAWCACYTSFCLNFAGITEKGHWNAALANAGTKIGLDQTITNVSEAKTMDLVSVGSHVAFAVLEDSTKPNGYRDTLHFMGGNQGDSVKLNPKRFYGNISGFARNAEYDKEISAGDYLSVLSYFQNANLKSSDERQGKIEYILTGKIQNFGNVAAGIQDEFTREVIATRKLIGESGFKISEPMLRQRFEELKNFEKSLASGVLPVTQNITGKQTAKSTNTR